MADPTIQTFCCHLPNITDRAVKIMMEFNSDTYNTVCLLSSSIGILGALYQILPRAGTKLTHRWYNFSSIRGRQIVIWLAFADLLASIGVFVRSAIWLHMKNVMHEVDDTTNVLICAISSAWIQYFYTATWLWTLCYAVDMRLVLREREGHPRLYHTAAWLIPALLTSVGLIVLYLPHANCHNLSSLSSALLHILPNYCATYIPIAIVMIANPILYVCSTQDVENIISRSLNQFTSKEREILDAIKIKFSLINIVFYFCWLPNIINGILLWALWFNLPENIIVSLWYIMAVTNPLQALCNSLVYRRWSGSADQLYIPCRQMFATGNTSQPNQARHSNVLEGTPLLHSRDFRAVAARSVNGTFTD